MPPLYPGGVSQAELEARLRQIRNEIRQLAAEAGSQSAQTLITTYIARAVTTLNYSDLSNVPTSFNPSAHAATHAAAGTDPLAPADIGAYTTAQVDALLAALANARLGYVGMPTASQLDWLLVARDLTIPAADPGVAFARTNPADGDWIATVQLNGASQGTLTISTAGLVSWAVGADIVLAAGDRLELVAPATPDSVAADIQVAFKVVP